MDCQDIDHIQFGVLSTEDILKMSVCEIQNTKLVGPNSVYDSRMGVLELNETCPTCQENSKTCIGHFGHINLNVRVLHPLYHRMILSILKCICYNCSRLLLTVEKMILNNLLRFTNSSRFYFVVKNMDKVDVCSHCDACQPKYIFSTSEKQIYMIVKRNGEQNRIQVNEDEIYKIFSNICKEDIELLGLDPNKFHPKSLVLNTLPVLPPTSRPYVMADNVTCDDDLTLQYLEIIKSNAHIGNHKTTDFKKQKYIQILKFRIRSLFDNSNEKQKVSNGRPLKGIKKRLTGKEGIIRNNLMGKRVDKSARSVIGPDPSLHIDEIGIPHEIASILSYPVNVSKYNLEEVNEMMLKNQINFVIRNNKSLRINMRYATIEIGTNILYGDVIFRNGKFHKIIMKEQDQFSLEEGDEIYRDGVKVEALKLNKRKHFEIKIGDIIERKLKDGDILLLNRQPTLHRGSMIAQKVRIIPGKTIRLNLAITSSFNADFDGDEMNLFCPNNVEAESELRFLSSVDNFIINPQSSKSNIVLVQDTVLGIYKMTLLKQPPLAWSQVTQVASSIGFQKACERIQEKKPFFENTGSPGRFLFSLLLPSDFFYRSVNKVDPDEKELIVEHGILKSGALQKSDMNKIISLLYLEYSIERVKEFINDIQFLAMSYLLQVGFSIGIKDCILESREDIDYTITKSYVKAKSISETIENERIKEVYTTFNLGAARDFGLNIATKSMKKDNNFISTVMSGAKGQFFNIAQITGLLGQQNVNGARIPYSLSNLTRSLPHYPLTQEQYTDEQRFESKGFISSCFASGLNPREYYLHSLTGREGITDTAMKTATSGYIQRRMIKVAEDTKVHYDGTVRNMNDNIIQFCYGNNFMNPSFTSIKSENVLPLDASRIVDRLNYQHEVS